MPSHLSCKILVTVLRISRHRPKERRQWQFRLAMAGVCLPEIYELEIASSISFTNGAKQVASSLQKELGLKDVMKARPL